VFALDPRHGGSMLLGTNSREVTNRGLSVTQIETDLLSKTRDSDTRCCCPQIKYTTFALIHLGSRSAF